MDSFTADELVELLNGLLIASGKGLMDNAAINADLTDKIKIELVVRDYSLGGYLTTANKLTS